MGASCEMRLPEEPWWSGHARSARLSSAQGRPACEGLRRLGPRPDDSRRQCFEEATPPAKLVQPVEHAERCVDVVTSGGVEATARNAYDHGYNVALVVDAMTDLSAEAHRHSVEMTFPRIGETASTDEVLALLNQRN